MREFLPTHSSDTPLSLALLVHLLAHHPDCHESETDAESCAATYTYFARQIDMLLDCLLRAAESSGADAAKRRTTMVQHLFAVIQAVKVHEDVTRPLWRSRGDTEPVSLVALSRDDQLRWMQRHCIGSAKAMYKMAELAQHGV